MDLIHLMKRELIRRKYSVRTIKNYSYCVNSFLKFHKQSPKKLTKKAVKDWLFYLADRSVARSTLNLHLQALKFAFKNVLGKQFILSLPSTRKEKKLPIVLSKQEVFRIFSVIKNLKHKLMVKLLYSAGLRVSEIVRLKVEHLDFDNMLGWVRKGKGNKDRMFVIAKSIKKELLDFIGNREGFVFEGRRGHISIGTVQQIVKKATKKAKIKKRVHPHTLRHSFATHLVEDNYPLTTVQMLLGHNSLETTRVYVHIAKPSILGVRSPLDTL